MGLRDLIWAITFGSKGRKVEGARYPHRIQRCLYKGSLSFSIHFLHPFTLSLSLSIHLLSNKFCSALSLLFCNFDGKGGWSEQAFGFWRGGRLTTMAAPENKRSFFFWIFILFPSPFLLFYGSSIKKKEKKRKNYIYTVKKKKREGLYHFILNLDPFQTVLGLLSSNLICVVRMRFLCGFVKGL